MASLVPGFEYDIFISYRQKDNKNDGWVTGFVNHLKAELESTFKEDVSLYFDINPHDGLLEIHDVDASLKEKLKCLIFIPIISRTYCDTKAFAWEHEFKAFVEQASHDEPGLMVRLPNGNVSGRILPVRIHDLDPDDIKLCESLTGSVLRGIEFIYKEPGVNRSLMPDDNPESNLNKTNYRNQVNKVALAIKEIINAVSQREPLQNKKVFSTKLDVNRHVPGEKHNVLLITTAAILLIILGLIFIPKMFKQTLDYERSIAVLPFINDSPDQENEYFINGIMEEVLNNLQKIKDIRVLSRTSTEQYRNSVRPSIPKIGKALNVSYILEGSGQKYGDVFRLRVQLIEAATDKHLWAMPYEMAIKESAGIFSIQNQIAESIANELKAFITPEEKKLISKFPTSNITAYDIYLKANSLKDEYMQQKDLGLFKAAAELYKSAFGLDAKFARAYTGLAQLYSSRYYWESYFDSGFLDTSLVLVNTAISIDDQLDEAYLLKGTFLRQSGKNDEALKNYDKAIELNPNNFLAYSSKGYLLTWIMKDYIKGIENYQKALNLVQGEARLNLLGNITRVYLDIGFVEKSKDLILEMLSIDNDSASYYGWMAWIEFNLENFDKALVLGKKESGTDTSSYIAMDYYSCLGPEYKEEAYLNARKVINSLKSRNNLPLQWAHRLGYALWQVGMTAEADHYFKEQIRYGEESIKLNRDIAQKKAAQYDLAGTYAFLGNREKAYSNLEEFGNMNTYPLWWVSLIRHDPLFNNIRSEERFQKILHRVESRHNAEHEKVKRWLKEKGEL